jgi:prepilin-type N-terminal cleavage/methylation domain-containing protein
MRTSHARGFTLLEVLLSVAILGALGVLVLSSLTVGAKGFMSTRSDVGLTQRARLALNRMTYEVRRMTAISNAQATSITYTDKDGASIILTKAGSTITLGGNLLIEDLATYPNGTDLFTYRQADGSAWTTANDFNLLSEITIILRLTPPRDPVGGTIVHTYTATINPRSNKADSVP